MHLDACAVLRHGFDANAHHLLALELLKYLVEYSSFVPSAHAGVDRVPVSESLRQIAPLATILGHVKYGIDDLQIAHTGIASLPWQTVLDERESLGCDIHAQQCQSKSLVVQLVLTGAGSAFVPLDADADD